VIRQPEVWLQKFEVAYDGHLFASATGADEREYNSRDLRSTKGRFTPGRVFPAMTADAFCFLPAKLCVLSQRPRSRPRQPVPAYFAVAGAFPGMATLTELDRGTGAGEEEAAGGMKYDAALMTALRLFRRRLDSLQRSRRYRWRRFGDAPRFRHRRGGQARRKVSSLE
jgi:hypothetical protein